MSSTPDQNDSTGVFLERVCLRLRDCAGYGVNKIYTNQFL